MSYREIRTFDDEVLRKTCKIVTDVNDHIRHILDDMVDTMRQTPYCGGLAANQLGILHRLVVIDVGQGLFKLVNPVVIAAKGEQIVTEGCLSFPQVWGKVKRPKRVTVQALNEWGESITVQGDDLLAQCLCHETEHLDGILFIDKVITYLKPQSK